MIKTVTLDLLKTALPVLMGLAAALWGFQGAIAEEVDIIQPIKPVPKIIQNNTAAASGRRLAIDGRGRVDRIDGDQIVIDDTLKQMAPGVTVMSYRGGYLSGASVKKGAWVGFRVDAEDRITHLLLLKSTRN